MNPRNAVPAAAKRRTAQLDLLLWINKSGRRLTLGTAVKGDRAVANRTISRGILVAITTT